jgi:hypothetical protein
LMMMRYHPTVLNEAATADKEAMDKRATEEAVAKRATKERATKEAVVTAAAAEEVAGKIVAPPRYPNVPIGVFGNLSLSSFLSRFFSFFSGASFSYYTFCPDPDGQPQTPEGVPEDVVEDSEGEAEVALEPVPEVVWEEAPTEGAMIDVCAAAAPLPSRGARAPLSSAPHRAAASGAATNEGMEVVLGHPTPYASGDISVGEDESTAHQSLS